MGCLLLGVLGGICLAADSQSCGSALMGFAMCTFGCNSFPLFALIIYGWVHQARVTCLMTVLSISIQLKSLTATCSMLKKGSGVGQGSPLIWQPPVWIFKSLLNNVDKFVVAALLGEACLHCAYTAGLCSAPSPNSSVPVACIDAAGVTDVVSAKLNGLMTKSVACTCSTYAAGLQALLNTSKSWDNSSIILLSTTDSSVEALVSSRNVAQRTGMAVSCFSNSAGGVMLGTLNTAAVHCAPIQEVSYVVLIGVTFAALVLSCCTEGIIFAIEASFLGGGLIRPRKAISQHKSLRSPSSPLIL